jgi:O-acetyl-ADP-ribose deacetylase (regulator of RNase III)
MKPAQKVYTFPSGQVLQISQGDITAETVDAIVNTANAYLEHGAGVAGAIVQRGGQQIQAESSQWVREHGLVSHAEPAYTHAGYLPCRYVIHAVGPRWGEGDETDKLGAAVRGSLQLAERLSLSSIAFPAISTGIFGFPKLRAAQVMLSTIRDYLANNPDSSLKLIRLVLYDQETLRAFVDTWEQDDHFGA